MMLLPASVAKSAAPLLPCASYSWRRQPQLHSCFLRSPTVVCRPLSTLPRPRASSPHDESDNEDEDVEDGEGWLERKPRGFGEGKTYDTTIEEQLLREMGMGARHSGKKEECATKNTAAVGAKLDKLTDVITSGGYVRIWNLPRKKNIHRDLQLVFKGFPGLKNITPIVSGNKKTRDPICKGFAFVGMESAEVASRFVEIYSKKIVPFGKVQKQINCCVVDIPSSSRSSNQMSDAPRFCQPEVDLKNGVASRSNKNDEVQSPETSFDGLVDATSGNESKDALLVNGGGPLSDLDCSNTGGNLTTVLTSNGAEGDNKTQVPQWNSADPMPLRRRDVKQKISKKKRVKPRPAKESNLSFPGSISRLKLKERTVLNGVFSKYGGKTAVSLTKEG